MEDVEKLIIEANNLQKKGDFVTAEKIYKKIIESYNDHPDATHNLANLYFTMGNNEEALRYIEITIKTKYPMQEYFLTAARIYVSLNKKNLAIQALDTAIEVNSDELYPLYLKSVILKDLGKYSEAKICAEKVLNKHPKNTVLLNHYGIVLLNINQYEESIKYFNKAIELNQNYRDPHSNLGLALHRIQKYNLSIESYKKSLSLDKNHTQTIINIGSVYQELGNYNKAKKYYKDAIKKDPMNSDAYNNMAVLYGEIGKKENAAEYYRKSLKINPSNYKAFRHLCSTGLIDPIDPIFSKMEQLFKNNIPENDKILIGFGLGFIYDKAGKYKKAFKFFNKANSLQNKKILSTNDSSKIKEATNTQYDIFLKKDISSENDFRPIFIVGMPRSGTTMIEKVLGNSDHVKEMGELVTLNNLITSKVKEGLNWPYNISLLNQKDLEEFKNDYITVIKEINPSVGKIFVDKMPGNFVHIGLLKKIFPLSKIVNVKRNPIDTCLSIYLLKFSDQHRYSFNLKNLAEYYNYYLDIMDYWRRQFPNQIHDLKYESFIDNPVFETKKLYKFCEISYQENNERFDLNKGIARTASNHQVKEKIHKKSFNRWKNYEEELKELITILKNRKGA